MRNLALLVICSGLVGCAATRPQSAALPQYSEAAASALAFEPPIAAGQPHPELARANRQPAAFLGFDLPTEEQYFNVTNDLQSDFGDSYLRQSISVRIGDRIR